MKSPRDVNYFPISHITCGYLTKLLLVVVTTSNDPHFFIEGMSNIMKEMINRHYSNSELDRYQNYPFKRYNILGAS